MRNRGAKLRTGVYTMNTPNQTSVKTSNTTDIIFDIEPPANRIGLNPTRKHRCKPVYVLNSPNTETLNLKKKNYTKTH